MGLCPLQIKIIKTFCFFLGQLHNYEAWPKENWLRESFPVGHHEFWDRCCWSGMKDSRECCCVSSNTMWAEVFSSFGVGAYNPKNAEILSHGFELELHRTLYSECCTDIRWFIFTTLLCKNYPQFRNKRRKLLSEDSGWELFLIAKLLTSVSFGQHGMSLQPDWTVEMNQRQRSIRSSRWYWQTPAA